MTIEIKAPTLPESVPDGTIATWHKKVGDAVRRDEPLVDIETDKVVIEVVSPIDGRLKAILKDSGETIVSNQAIGSIAEEDLSAQKQSPPAESEEAVAAKDTKSEPKSKSELEPESKVEPVSAQKNSDETTIISPAARKILEEKNLSAADIVGSGKDGRITKEDVTNFIDAGTGQKPAATAEKPVSKPAGNGLTTANIIEGRVEERVPMSRLRARVAERLLQVSESTAMLTTFNEVNMKPVMDLRNRYKDLFEKTHDGVRLGFMSFFVRASVEALKKFPAVNASIDGEDIVYHGYQDIGVAVSTPRGLVVPVLRNADHMGLAAIEKQVRAYGDKAKDGKLTIEEMTGGTFTISNGGVFGSLLSTPILNPPQTAILGMHKIQERPMAVDGKVEILPMMYLALSYDHCMIDGKEAVQFLVTVKELLEDPARILLEI